MNRLIDNIKKVIKGKDAQITLLAAALLAKGHVLIEDVPGTGKTVLARSLCKSINAEFRRVQFTPDLLPSDITGINFFNMKTQDFVLKKGGVFTNILLADEINRATPRTQSALLECMEERQVTIDGETYALGEPFMVIATQNPIEIQGTYPLPEAQLDRFLIRITLGYADKEAEMKILGDANASHPLERIETVMSADDVRAEQERCARVLAGGAVREYIADLGAATRNHDKIRLGLSTRGLIALKKTAQAFAYLNGKKFVSPRDVKEIAPYVMSHRIITRDYADKSAAALAGEILGSVRVPTESADG
ncbi:MAG: AAA family ATPase [Oscillospiraceae bacterium]|jgi:MoxR-like ATPase|nr:AAA family ATPase [Oscillospiraceae bacterium]